MSIPKRTLQASRRLSLSVVAKPVHLFGGKGLGRGCGEVGWRTRDMRLHAYLHMQGGTHNTRALKWLESGGSRRVADLMTLRLTAGERKSERGNECRKVWKQERKIIYGHYRGGIIDDCSWLYKALRTILQVLGWTNIRCATNIRINLSHWYCNHITENATSDYKIVDVSLKFS